MKNKKYLLLIINFIFLSNILSSKTFASIYISEIYPAPKTGDKEWVEIYSNEENSIDLSNYYIQDLAGNKISTNGIILNPNTYVSVLSSNILNNSGDTVYLKNSENLIVDTVIYPSIESEKSYTFCPLQDQWIKNTVSSKDQANYDICEPYFITPSPTPTNTPIPTRTPTPTKTPTPSTTPAVSGVELLRASPTPTKIFTSTPVPTNTPTLTPSLTITPQISKITTSLKLRGTSKYQIPNIKLIISPVVTIQDIPTPTLFPDEPVKKPDNLPGLWTFGFSLLNIFIVLNKMNG